MADININGGALKERPQKLISIQQLSKSFRVVTLLSCLFLKTNINRKGNKKQLSSEAGKGTTGTFTASALENISP